MDSRRRNRRIIQVRNPWGNFEWNGEFSDNSSAWTEKLKQKLKVVNAEDGLFWMPWEEFCRFFAEISILKVKPGYVNNSLHIRRVDKMEQTIVRMTVNKPNSHLYLSIDQIDSRCIDKRDYSYSCILRITVARIHENDTLDFIGYSYSCERNIFMELDKVEAGATSYFWKPIGAHRTRTCTRSEHIQTARLTWKC